MRSRLTGWLWAIGLLLYMLPIRALAAEPPPSPASPTRATAPSLVNVVVVGAELGASFEQRVQSWFSNATRVNVVSAPLLRADLILSPKASDLVDVWLDLRTPGVAHVYLVVSGPTGERCLVRDVQLTDGLDEVGHEGLAQVIYSAVLAVWEGRDQSARGEFERRLGVSPAAPRDTDSRSRRRRPLAPRPSRKGTSHAQQQTSPSKGTSVHGGYGASWRGQEGLAHGPEAWGTIWERHGRTRLSGVVMARYLVPVHALADAVTLTLTGARLQIGVSAGRNVSEAIGVQAGASLGAVLIHYRPQVTDDVSRTLHAESSEMELRPIASVFLAAAARLGPVELGLVPQMDLQLTRTSYEVSRDGTLVPLFKPWILQPGLALLVGWNISAPRSYQSNPQRIAASAKPPPR